MKMKCPKCQFENREGIKFCEKCGAKLELVCPNCRANIPLDREFCGECGHNLATPSPTQAPPVELSFEEKLENIQRYLPGGLTEKILAQRGKIEGERKQVTVLLCNTEGFSTLYERLSAFVVDMHSAGEICDIVLDNVRVSKGNLIGDQNTGFAVATQNLGGGRIVVGATGVGIAQAAFEESVKYAKQRKQFGKEIDQFEVIQFYLADMAILIGAARNLNYHAASLKDVDLPHTRESAVAHTTIGALRRILAKESRNLDNYYSEPEDSWCPNCCGEIIRDGSYFRCHECGFSAMDLIEVVWHS